MIDLGNVPGLEPPVRRYAVGRLFWFVQIPIRQKEERRKRKEFKRERRYKKVTGRLQEGYKKVTRSLQEVYKKVKVTRRLFLGQKMTPDCKCRDRSAHLILFHLPETKVKTLRLRLDER